MNAAASQVRGPGSRRCCISADGLNDRLRCPHSKRSVWRRLTITTNASRYAPPAPPDHRRRAAPLRTLEVPSLPAGQWCADVGFRANSRNVRRPDQCATGEVRDQVGHRDGIEDRAELASDSLGGSYRRIGLGCLKHPSDIETSHGHHLSEHRRASALVRAAAPGAAEEVGSASSAASEVPNAGEEGTLCPRDRPGPRLAWLAKGDGFARRRAWRAWRAWPHQRSPLAASADSGDAS
jgi:hypothetical protein